MNSLDLIKEIQDASKASVEIELKAHYLLGETDEFDNFQPELISLSLCNDFDAFKVACCKYVGYKTVDNEKEAYEIWERLAVKGEPNSMLEHSAKLFKDSKIKEGFTFLLNASRKGNLTAIFRVALCYLHGIYVKQDEAKATQLITLLAQKKYPDAIYFMSILHSIGTNSVEYNEEKAEKLLLESVRLESKFGQTEYGFKLFVGENDVEKKKKGFDLIKDSADAGDPRAMTMLSIIYAKGEEGVIEQSEEQSKVYLALAFDLGYSPAVKMVEEMKNADENV